MMPRRRNRQQRQRRRQRRPRPSKRKPHPIKTIAQGLVVAVVAGMFGWSWWSSVTPRQVLPPAPAWLPKCPVGGGPVNLAHCVSTPEGPVFLCCEHCIERFEATPSEFEANVEAQREALNSLSRVQVACPVSGDPIDPTIQIQGSPDPIYFCSAECRERFSNAPARYREGFANSFWYQTICPVNGNPINPSVSTTLGTGEVVFFCSKQCRDELKGDPAAYATRLAQQGIRLHVE